MRASSLYSSSEDSSFKINIPGQASGSGIGHEWGALPQGGGASGPREMAPVSPLDPLLVRLSPSNPNRHGRGSQYTGPGLHMACSHPDFSVAACQQYMAAGCKESRCLTQRAGVFSNPSVDADEGMAWQGKGLWWTGACLGCRLSLSLRVKGPGPQSERATGLVGPCLLAAEQACLHVCL